MDYSHLAVRIKEYRMNKGLSQEALANKSGLSHRTIQRIENGESNPTGDTLQRVAEALDLRPDELIDWTIKEDNGFLVFLNLAALSFLIFPLLGILIPFIMWTSKKDKLKDVYKVGISLINFEISWVICLFLLPISLVLLNSIGFLQSLSISRLMLVVIVMYLLNIALIAINTSKILNKKNVRYYSLIKFLK